MGWTLSATIALYGLGLIHSIIGFCTKREIFLRLALGLVAGGFVFHTLSLVMLGIQRIISITNLPESFCFSPGLFRLLRRELAVQINAGRIYSSIVSPLTPHS
jgi:hypothetical protein